MNDPILIVEDESAIAETIAYALAKEGFAPARTTLGEEALTRLAGEPFRLVILDVGLPDISGFEVLRRLQTFSAVPVVFLTARNEEVDRIVGLEIGADDYMAKPFSPRELVARVRGILRRVDGCMAHREPGTPPAQNPRFRVDDASRRIWYGGTLLDLTRYEHLLLKTLLAHPGQVFTRAQLMERVWAGAEESSDRTVDTHVKTLRAKLRAAHPEADPIETHRGVGYSIGDPA